MRRRRRGEDARHLAEALEEDVRVRRRQLEVELREHGALGREDLLARVRLVRDVHKVAALGRVDLLVLRRDEHRRDPDELQLVPLHRLLLEVAVDQVDGEVHRLGAQLELVVHLDQPVDEDRAHLVVDVKLAALHVRRRRQLDRLRAEARSERGAARGGRAARRAVGAEAAGGGAGGGGRARALRLAVVRVDLLQVRHDRLRVARVRLVAGRQLDGGLRLLRGVRRPARRCLLHARARLRARRAPG